MKWVFSFCFLSLQDMSIKGRFDAFSKCYDSDRKEDPTLQRHRGFHPPCCGSSLSLSLSRFVDPEPSGHDHRETPPLPPRQGRGRRSLKMVNNIEIVLRSEEHTSELQSRGHLVCRLLLEKKKKTNNRK